VARDGLLVEWGILNCEKRRPSVYVYNELTPEMQQKVYVQEKNMPKGWLVEKKNKKHKLAALPEHSCSVM